MLTYLLEPAIVGPVLANKDRINGSLHVVVNLASTGIIEEGERPAVGIEDHLLSLAGIRSDERHPAVAETAWATLTVVVTPWIRTISLLQSNW